jgi:hypothetical protein
MPLDDPTARQELEQHEGEYGYRKGEVVQIKLSAFAHRREYKERGKNL